MSGRWDGVASGPGGGDHGADGAVTAPAAATHPDRSGATDPDRNTATDPGRGGGKGEQTRRAVLEAAIGRFGREGYRATSVADVARDAGVGGTVPYAYFPNKEALFLAAIDEDAARLIDRAVAPIALSEPVPDWPQQLIAAAVAAMEERPLARRILAGLEPEVTARVLEIPALAELRKTAAERLRADQAAGRVRPDIDPVATAAGSVTIMLSLLMSVVQVGREVAAAYGDGVASVLQAAVECRLTEIG